VGIGATGADGWVAVSVADDGPGIEPTEYDVLKRGTETPLRHGSGIGLWIVKWGVDHLGGRISFDERDPRGTAVTVCVPVDRDEPDGSQWIGGGAPGADRPAGDEPGHRGPPSDAGR
jgi:sensor histidine kinase regulating citrate/malate metabolism